MGEEDLRKYTFHACWVRGSETNARRGDVGPRGAAVARSGGAGPAQSRRRRVRNRASPARCGTEPGRAPAVVRNGSAGQSVGARDGTVTRICRAGPAARLPYAGPKK